MSDVLISSVVTAEKASFYNLGRLLHAPLSILAMWSRRARLRAQLAADLRERPEYLRDIGICEYQARSEAVRFFWEPILLKHRRVEMVATPMR
jgi:uncharacterized protein YjiS (DUF1127 family)